MIVKLVIHKSLNQISIWDKEGQRLYYSDKPDDIKTAKELLMIIKKPTDKATAEAILKGEVVPEVKEQRMFGYFNACWAKGIVQLKKRASGYDW